DGTAVASLLRQGDLFEDSDLFAGEHGIAAILPFVKRFFPAARIVPIVISVDATRADWDRAYAAIRPLVDARTLVVQSTDFSHYLAPEIAMQRDQETLNVIASGSLDAVAALIQPDHLDSKGGQYIQMRLQAALGSRGTVIANRNSAEYEPIARKTTSY